MRDVIRLVAPEHDDLTPRERLRFNSRFMTIYMWARSLHHVVPFWQDVLGSDDHLGACFFVDLFENGLSTSVKKLLSQSGPPTIDQLLALELVANGRVGTYAKIAHSKNTSKAPNVLYVGFSASTSGTEKRFGMKIRQKQHELTWNTSYE